MESQPKILFLLKLPPPITGATVVNQFVSRSQVLLNTFVIQTLPISYKDRIDDVHIFSIRKIIKIIVLHIKLLRALVTFNPSIVYFQISPLGWAFYRDCTYVLWLKIFRKRLVLHLHGKGIRRAVETSSVASVIYKWVFKGSSVICLSPMLVDDIAPVYADVPYIVNNGIPIVPQDEVNIDGKENTTIRVLFLSNLLHSKGILAFLDALMMLRRSYQNKISVQIVGKEAELSVDMLGAEIEKRGIHRFVSYAGPKYGGEKDKIFRQTDILVYPTLNDAFPLVLLEAMQFGISIIATREGAIPEIVDDGTTGFLVDKNSPTQIAEKLTLLIENPDICRSMGKSGRTKFLEQYTLDHFEESMKSVIGNVYTNIELKKKVK